MEQPINHYSCCTKFIISKVVNNKINNFFIAIIIEFLAYKVSIIFPCCFCFGLIFM